MQKSKNRLSRLFSSIVALIIIPVSVSVAQGPPPDQGYELLFEENFEGDSIDPDLWVYRERRRTAGDWINGYSLKEKVYLKDGMLHIEADYEKVNGEYEYTGGGIISKMNFGYGYYESVSKPYMAGTGVHTSFWQAGSQRPNNNIFEIDGYEIDSKSKMACNNLYVHLASKDARIAWPHRGNMPYVTDEDGWILDAWEYTPDGVNFFDGGKLVATAEWKDLTAQQQVWLTALNGCGQVDIDALPGESLFKYFRYYAKDYPGVNLLPNGDFEYNQDKVNPSKPVSWTPVEDGSAILVVEGDAANDRYKLRFDDDKNYKAVLEQKIEFIRNGAYMLTAQVRSNNKTGVARINVNGEDYTLNLPVSKKWKQVELSNITVENNEAHIAISVSGQANEWLEMDDVKFMKPPLEGQTVRQPGPLKIVQEPLWHLAKAEPIVFPGDDRFFFFDRFLGYGDAISVAFTIKADRLANMTPIARIPKTGQSGWLIGLREDGGLIFRIGSQADYTDVVAQDVYTAGKECQVVCQFDNGTASIYLDGKLIASRTGIIQDTLDKTAAGKLGSVGWGYEAINGVVQESEEKQNEMVETKNFKGTIQNVKIYNKAIPIVD